MASSSFWGKSVNIGSGVVVQQRIRFCVNTETSLVPKHSTRNQLSCFRLPKRGLSLLVSSVHFIVAAPSPFYSSHSAYFHHQDPLKTNFKSCRDAIFNVFVSSWSCFSSVVVVECWAVLKIPMMSYYCGSGMAKCGSGIRISVWKTQINSSQWLFYCW